MSSRIPKYYFLLKIIYKIYIIHYKKEPKIIWNDYNGDISRKRLQSHPKNIFLDIQTVQAGVVVNVDLLLTKTTFVHWCWFYDKKNKKWMEGILLAVLIVYVSTTIAWTVHIIKTKKIMAPRTLATNITSIVM